MVKIALQSVGLWVPLAADGVTQVQHPAELLRASLQANGRRPGVCMPGTTSGLTNTGDFAATVVPGAMQLTLAAGKCLAPGQENSLQAAGDYFAYSQASETISWPAAGGSNRMDSLLLQWADPQYGSIGGTPLGASWRAVAGSSASARPDTDFKVGGSQYVPGAWIRMYDILVPTSATQLTQANVTFKAGYSNVNGVTPFFSAARPNGIYYGEFGYELDTGRRFIWNGAAWTWPYPRGRVGGIQWSGTGTFASGVSGEATNAALTLASFTPEANRAYKLKARVQTIGSANAIDAAYRIRETNASGAIRAETVSFLNKAIYTYKIDLEGEWNSGASPSAVIWCITLQALAGGTVSLNGTGSNFPSYFDILDEGPTGNQTASALP